MILTEYDEDFNNKTWYEDGVEDGKKEKALEAAENFLKEGIQPETIAKCTGLSLEQVQELQKKISRKTVFPTTNTRLWPAIFSTM